MDENFQQLSVLKLLESHISHMDDEFKTLDEKAWRNASVSSIITALISAFNVNMNNPLGSTEYIIVLVVYIAIFILSYVAHTPKTLRVSFKPTWEEAQRVLGKTPDDYYDWLVATHTETIEYNQRVLDYKARFVQITTVLVGIEIVLIVLFALI